jgi:hypothetical protein
MPEPEQAPDPDEVQDQMRSAIERIRARLVEPEGKLGDTPTEDRADAHS